MIQIVKPVKVPKSLMTKGAEQIRKDCAAYDANPAAYRSGAQKFHIDSKIYGHKSVQEALRRAQHEKCCYCEAKFLSTSYGAVEHYRPKGAVQQARGQKKESPGYYWLVYDWNNLLFSCTVCNTKKGELFPLMDNNARAHSHHSDIAMEQPFLVNPAVENPRDHIRFREDAPEPLTEIGRITIEILGLHRAYLEEDRKKRLKQLQSFRDILELSKKFSDPKWQQLRNEVMKEIEAAIRPEAEYSAMAQNFINAWTSFPPDTLPSSS